MTDEERRKKLREKQRDYRRRNPGSVARANRAAYDKKRIFITDPAERAAMLADPRKRPEVCRECWQALPGQLNSTHLARHGLDAEAYKDKFGFNRSQGLHTEAMAAKLGARRRGDPKALGQQHGKRALEKFEEAGGKPQKPLSLQARLDRSAARTGVARPDLTAVPSSEIVSRWLIENKDTAQIAKETGLDKDTIHRRLRVILGVHPRATIRRLHGEVLSDAWLEKMMQRFGDVYRSQVARAIDMPAGSLYSISRKRKNLAIVPSRAQRLIELERQVLQILLADKGRQPAHLAAVIPDLLEKAEAAREAVTIFRAVLDDREKMDVAVEELCLASQRANTQTRAILLWMPELLDWLRQNRSQLYRKASELSLEFVAHDLGIKSWLVWQAMHSAPTARETIHSIVNANLRARPERKKRGREPDPDTRERIRQVAAFDLLSESGQAPMLQKHFAEFVFSDTVAADGNYRVFKCKPRYQGRIDRVKKNMTIEEARGIVKSLTEQA